MVAIKKIQSPKKKQNVKWRTLHDKLHVSNKNPEGRTLHDQLHQWLMHRTVRFNTLLCYGNFTHLCRVSKRRELGEKRKTDDAAAYAID